MTMIHVAICIDKNLQDKLDNCLKSILRNTKEKVNIIILCLDDVDQDYIDSWQDEGFTVLYGIDTDLEIKLNDNFVKSSAMYLRFFLAEQFPFIDKIIYTEADSVYNCDIAEHCNIDIGDNFIGAVRDWFSPTCKELQRWSGKIQGYDEVPAYLTGNMIINCKAWRENKIQEKLVNIVKENNIRVNLAMSIICRDKIFNLDKKWCFPANYEIANDDTKILHWSGSKKPWAMKCKNQEIWNKYA